MWTHIVGSQKSAIWCPIDTRTPLWLKAWVGIMVQVKGRVGVRVRFSTVGANVILCPNAWVVVLRLIGLHLMYLLHVSAKFVSTVLK